MTKVEIRKVTAIIIGFIVYIKKIQFHVFSLSGEDCFYKANLDKFKIRDMYMFMYPCAEGLTCIAKETEEDNVSNDY